MCIRDRGLGEGVLYAATTRGLEPLPRFRAVLFRALWERLAHVVTQTGAMIRTDSRG